MRHRVLSSPVPASRKRHRRIDDSFPSTSSYPAQGTVDRRKRERLSVCLNKAKITSLLLPYIFVWTADTRKADSLRLALNCDPPGASTN